MSCFLGRENLVTRLINHNLPKPLKREMVDHTDIYGNNALHIAAIRNKLQIAMALYSKYPSLNCINEV